MLTFRQLVSKAAFVLVFAPAIAFAQPQGGSLISSLDPDVEPDTIRITGSNRAEVENVKANTADGALSVADLAELFDTAGATINEREMEIVRLALAGKVPGGPDFAVDEDVEDAAIDMLYARDLASPELADETKALLAEGKSYAGTEVPRSVKEVVAIAKLNGAKAYDVNEEDDDGELIYTHYPSLNPPTENMAWDYTEVTPASLQADADDTEEHLRISGSRSVTYNGRDLRVGRYVTTTGGTGSISAAYDEAFHPVMRIMPHILTELGYEATLSPQAVQNARSSSGNKWSSNCAILADGTIHCLPAVRRHSSTGGLILTNPALARGERLLWNGHFRVSNGKVTYIGTSGGIAKRAARGKDIIINPIPLLEAWGFEMSENLNVVSEHRTARPSLDAERAIMFAEPEVIPAD